MTRIVWFRRILLVLLLLFIGTLLVSFQLRNRGIEPAPVHEEGRSASLDLTGVDLAYEDAGQKVRLQADRLVHQARRVGPLTINLLKEIQLEGVRLIVDDVVPDAGTTTPSRVTDGFLDERIVSSIRGAFTQLLAARNLGFISRVLVVGFDLELRRNGAEAAQLHAGRARLDAAGRGFTLGDGVDVTSPSGDRLKAQEVSWDPGVGKLVISGSYLLRRGDEARSGSGGAMSIASNGQIVVD